MSDIVFPEPVIVTIPSNRKRQVATSFEALECLEGPWPERARGPHWRRAVTACRDALDGWRSAVEARRLFVEAARQAGLIQDRRRSIPRHDVRTPQRMMPAESRQLASPVHAVGGKPPLSVRQRGYG